MGRDYYFSSKSPHRIHEAMYYYDSPFGNYFGGGGSSGLPSGTGANGKSAYEIAVENGFIGTEQEWLDSLKGITPHIGENGNWFIDDLDTGVSAGATLDYNLLINKPSIEGKEMIDDVELDSISTETLDTFFNDKINLISQEDLDNFFNQGGV